MAVRPPVRLTPAQLRLRQAAAVAQASLAPQESAVNLAVKQAEADRIAGLNAAAGVTRAVAGMSAGDAAAAQAGYKTAADDVARYAQGFTGQLKADQLASAGADQGLISRLGAPGSVVDHADANANVNYMLGGQIPATGLAHAAAAALENIQGRRYAGGVKLADDANATAFNEQRGIDTTRSRIAQLEASRPGLIQSALDHLNSQAQQKRALDVQVGTLQLQQAKTLADQAVGLTNLTGTLHIVVGKGASQHVVDTRQPAAGSDAGVAISRANTAAADRAAAQERARLAAQTQREVAQTSADARAAASQSSAASAANVARINAAAKKAAAEVAAQKKNGKAATPKQRSDIIKAAGVQGAALMKTTLDRIAALTPDLDRQRVNETPEAYAARHQHALVVYRRRLHQHRAEIVNRVAALITPTLKQIGYDPNGIAQQAEAIVSASIPPGLGAKV